MKKSIIAAGAASVALAAMPIVGAFAEQTTVRNITDTVELNLALACSMTVTPTGSQAGITTTTEYDDSGTTTEEHIIGAKYAGTLAAGNAMEIVGTAMQIACNDTDGWAINAIGAGSGTDVTYMDATTSASDDIATGVTALDGTVSEWGFKIAVNDNTYATIQDNGVSGKTYADYSVIPATSTEIVGFDGPIAAGSPVTVTPTYKVSFSSTQPAATYTGKVNYTLLHPES